MRTCACRSLPKMHSNRGRDAAFLIVRRKLSLHSLKVLMRRLKESGRRSHLTKSSFVFFSSHRSGGQAARLLHVRDFIRRPSLLVAGSAKLTASRPEVLQMCGDAETARRGQAFRAIELPMYAERRDALAV